MGEKYLLFFVILLVSSYCKGESPYRFYTWNVTYGDIYPLGAKQQGILINGQFPGPPIEAVTNDNLVISVFNGLDEPFLLSWNGIQQRKNSWQDGVYGTNCPIPPGQNFTYILQAKDQIGSYFYFPSLAFHKAAGGYGGIKLESRPLIPVPFPPPAGDFTVLAGDWFKMNHTLYLSINAATMWYRMTERIKQKNMAIGNCMGSSKSHMLNCKENETNIYSVTITRERGILINGQFPGPPIEAVTNDNLIISVFNYLNEPFLLTWNGLQHRKNSWQDSVYGTNCPIPPGKNFTYILQAKDQIGSYFYCPSLAFHKAAGGYGGIRLDSRPRIPVSFPPPAGDFTVLTGDWYTMSHTALKAILDNGNNLPFPDGLLINGYGSNRVTYTVDQGKTYRFRISNVGIATSINFRIQGHNLLLVETEGAHTIQNAYSSLDVHLGQSYSVLVTANQAPKDYYIVVSTRFTSQVLTCTATLHYSNSAISVSGPPPGGPTTEIDWSLNQARSIRQNLTASGPRPNPQGSYHYGLIHPTRTIRLANSAPVINGKQRYAVNSVSFIPADTPLKLADYFNIPGVFTLGSIPDSPNGAVAHLQTSVMEADYRSYVEVVFENHEDTIQSWHVDGQIFFVVGMDGGQWSPYSRSSYNLRDTISRSTVQVYPHSWTAVYMPLDNVGMWNVRSQNWARQYLGQQFYLRVYTTSTSYRDQYPIPRNAILCGRAIGHKTRLL